MIDYLLPQSTCFNAVGEVVLNIPSASFLQTADDIPAGNFWESTQNLTIGEISERLNNELTGYRNTSLLGNIKYLQIKPQEISSISKTTQSVENTSGVRLAAGTSDASDTEAIIDGLSITEFASRCASGFRPILRRNLWGSLQTIFIPKPIAPVPQIKLILHYKMCTYSGDYEAGKTLKTFTLLPGERTSITINTYKNTIETQSKSENILDSYTESSANEIETILSQESITSNSYSNSSTNTSEVGGSLNVSLSLGDLASIGIGGGGGVSNQHTINNSMSQMVENLSSSVSLHVEQSSAAREVTVNNETSMTVEEGESTTIVREIENINYSRTLNFVFRQLLQEYISITFLDQVTLVFTNGYPESTIVSPIHNIDTFLGKVITTGQIATVRAAILNELCSIYDHTGTRQSFIEKVTENIVDCDNPATIVRTNTYWRKKKALTQTAEGFTVPGIILDVKNQNHAYRYCNC